MATQTKMTKAERKDLARVMDNLHKQVFELVNGDHTQFGPVTTIPLQVQKLREMAAPGAVTRPALELQELLKELEGVCRNVLGQLGYAHAELMDGAELPNVLKRERAAARRAGRPLSEINPLHFTYEMQDGVAVRKP